MADQTVTRVGDDPIDACPVCLGQSFKPRFVKKGRQFWVCRNCGLEKIYPLPGIDELRQYYDHSYLVGLYNTFINAHSLKVLTAQQRLKEIRESCPDGSWLDIGCSDGTFVECARELGIDAEGIDLSEVAIEAARNRNLPVQRITIEEYQPGHQYDVITAFYVLEHVLDPVQFLQSARQLLKPGGKLVLSLPNQGSLICKVMGSRWYFYIPEEHLYYFNPNTIRKLLDRVGFTVVSISRTYKLINYEYSLSQFKEFNPTIYTLLYGFSKILSKKIQVIPIPLYIGEMKILCQNEKRGC